MEAGAIQRYANSLKSYGDNIAGIRSALNEGVTLRQNNRLNAIATSQRQKLQNIFLSNVVEDEKLREIHEALGNLSIQAGAVPQAVKDLNNAGAFNPIKRAGASLLEKVKSAGTSVRLSGTAQPGDAIEMNSYDANGLAGDGSYKGPEIDDPETTYTPFEPNAPRPTAQSSLRTTLRNVKEPPSSSVGQSASTGEGSGQAGRVGQDFDDDMEDRFASLDRNVRPAGSAVRSTDQVTSSINNAANATEDAEEGATRGLQAGTSALEATEATEGATAATEGAEIGAGVAGSAAEAVGGGIGAALGSVASVAGPLSILAGLGFGIYELVQAFKPHPHPDMKKVTLPSQVKQTMNVTPSHRALSVAPSTNSALLQAGQSSAV
jgi:hypothetical protein